MIYFTADTHFGHANIIHLCDRPFSSVEEMDNTIIENINSVVAPDDTLYHLGDFCWWEKKDYTNRFTNNLSRIKCRNIHFVGGNHDQIDAWEILQSYGYCENLLSICYYNELNSHGRKIVLSHYPFQSWNGKNRGSIHLHGHTHANLQSPDCYRLDVGVDNLNFKPISINDAINMATTNKVIDKKATF